MEYTRFKLFSSSEQIPSIDPIPTIRPVTLILIKKKIL